MTKQEIKDLVALKIAGQGSAVDAGSALPQILDAIVDAIGEGGGGGSSDPVAITYNELKTLRDGGGLTVGGKYRITDYVATTVQEGTQSANHPFDIIVTATAANKLDEKASAALHDGDTYFANCDLSKWQLWYNLDNDTNKYLWADADNGKGVIYRMIDEFGNDCPFDFKGIQFKRYSVSSIDSYAQQWVGMYVLPSDASFEQRLNLVKSDSFAWFYTFSCSESQMPSGTEYFDTTVKICDAKKEYDVVEGKISGNRLVPYNNGDGVSLMLNGDVFFTEYYQEEDVDDDNNEIIYFGLKINPVNMELLGGSYNNTFIASNNSCFKGPVYGNIWTGCYGSTSLGSPIRNNIFSGQIVSLGDSGFSIFSNYILGSANVFYNEVSAVIAKKLFGQNIVQSMSALTFECGFIRGNIGNEVAYATITATNTSKDVEHAYILNGTRGTAASPITITFPHQEARFAQFAGNNSSGTVKVWVPADLVS